jgi:hypothetical protein
LLTYQETNWKYKRGFKIHNYTVKINKINASKTIKEQQRKLEKISLVVFLNKEQRRPFANICRHLKKINKNFYQNKNLHVTIFGFGPLNEYDYELIQNQLEKFSFGKRGSHLTMCLDKIRLGTLFSNNTLHPVQNISNGTVIAYGDVFKNEAFFKFTNELAAFLLKDEQVLLKLGYDFRKKFPALWCTLGYFNNSEELRVSGDLQEFFVRHARLKDNIAPFAVTEVCLVKSKYKNLRYPKIVKKYSF